MELAAVGLQDLQICQLMELPKHLVLHTASERGHTAER